MHRALLPGTGSAAGVLGVVVLVADVDAWTGGRRLPDDAHLLLTATAAVLATVALGAWFLRQTIEEVINVAIHEEVERCLAEVYRAGLVAGAQRTAGTSGRGRLAPVDD